MTPLMSYICCNLSAPCSGSCRTTTGVSGDGRYHVEWPQAVPRDRVRRLRQGVQPVPLPAVGGTPFAPQGWTASVRNLLDHSYGFVKSATCFPLSEVNGDRS